MFRSARKLIPFVYPYRWALVSSLAAGAVVAVLSTVLPLLAQLLIQALEQKDILALNPRLANFLFKIFPETSVRAITSDHFQLVKAIAICFPLYYLCMGWFRFYNYYVSRYIGELVTNELRYAIMDRLLSLNASFYYRSKTGSGGLLSRTLNDTLIIQNGMNTYVDLIREPLVAIVLVTYMLMLNWKLCLFCIVFAPIFAFVIRRLATSLKRLAIEGQNTLDVITKNLKETIDGMRVIQSYNLEQHMRNKFRDSINQYNHVRRKTIKRMEMTSPLNEFVASILVAIILLFVGQMIFRGEEDVAQFLAFIFAAGLLDKPVKKIQQSLVYNQQTDASIERVFEVINSQETITDVAESQAVEFPKNWKRIEFKNISFSYGGEMILKNINLTVERGEIIALVGESGSGKSTLVNLLERFFDPTEGSILIDGIDLRRFRLRDLRNEIALVTQDVFLFNETLDENIRAGDSQKTGEIVTEAAEKANASRFIDKLPQKFLSYAGERGSNFSGGEKQRISIARAIFKDAPILILDEATSALDSASEVEVQKGIKSLMTGRTAFIIAHRLSTISSAHRILVMQTGSIVEEGTHSELLAKNGVYAYYQQLQDQRG